MIGAGAAMLAAQEMRRMERELQALIHRLSHRRASRARPSFADIPLLVNALAIHDGGIRAEAHAALTALSGVDLGLEAARWRAWWEENREAFLAHEAEERAARELFATLRRDILTADWRGVRRSLARPVREAHDPDALEDALERSKRALREVYRDARVTGLRLGAREGALTVDWGKIVFEVDQLPLAREPDGWRFARLPWGARAEHRTKPTVRCVRTRQAPWNPAKARDRARRAGAELWALLFVPFGLCLLLALRVHPGLAAAVAGLIVLLLVETMLRPLAGRGARRTTKES